MISLKDGIRSIVRLDFQGRVHKQFLGTHAKERCENEMKVLKLLEERGCPNVPRLLEAMPGENYIITTSCGKPAEDTIPRSKAEALFQELEARYGVRHDDPEPRNITYDSVSGKFCVIDFELAEVLEQPSSVKNQEQALRIQWASDSKQGRRHLTNQDNLLCWRTNSKGYIVDAHRGEAILPCHKALFAVSDGVGGNNGGEFASSIVLSTMAHVIETEYKGVKIEPEDYIKILGKTNIQVNLRALQNPKAPHLSATYAGVILQGNTIMWANVGDSRVYLLRNQKLTQLSKDHNFAFRQMKSGELSEIQYRLHPRKNQLFDCMGAGHGNINPEHGTKKWKKDDLYLICSDGVMDGLTDSKIETLMTVTKGDINTTRAQAICDELLKQAVLNDGSDDTTLIVFQVL